MKLLELKFGVEKIKDKEENILELYLMENKIMKYIIRNEMFKNNDVRTLEGEVPSMFKNYIGGIKNGK